MSKDKKPKYFHGDQWYYRQLDRRTRQALGLPNTKPLKDPEQQSAYRKEFKRQVRLFRRERAEEKATRAIETKKRSIQAQAEYELLCRQEEAWGKAHKNDTDEELLEYIRGCAENLGHTPVLREVEGGTWLSQRFGSWSVALHLANLPLRHGMKPPSQATLNAYLKRQAKQN